MVFHVSHNKKIKLLKKRIPESIPISKNGLSYSKEDISIERVCFSLTIDGCLSAICPIENKNLYVYIPIDGKIKFLKPTIKQVFDSKVTKEVWLLNNVKVKCVGIIHATKLINKVKHKNYVKSFTEFVYEWKWVEKF